MATTYTVIVQETPDQRIELRKNAYNLAVAKSVIGPNGETSYNTIYGSLFLGPTMKISWTETYGLNFTTSVPTPGAQVEIDGDWQICELGDGYTLDPTGTWIHKTDNNTAGVLNVTNNYQPVSIIVGSQDPDTGAFLPIYTDLSQILPNFTGKYQPKESVEIWYGQTQETSAIVASQESAVETFDMATASNEKQYFQWAKPGQWSNQSQPYDPDGLAAGTGPVFVKFVQFLKRVAATKPFVDAFKVEMDKKGWNISVTAKVKDIDFQITASKKKEADDTDVEKQLVEDIGAALDACVAEDVLPSGEGWEII